MRSLIIGAALVASISSAAEAATIVTATYQGTLNSGQDWSGVFGAAQADLTGAAFTAVFVMDIDQPTRVTHPGVSDTVIGGGANSPYVAASITINNITFDFGPIDNGGVQVTAGNQSLNAFSQEDTDGVGIDFQLSMLGRFFGAPAIPSLLDTPFSTDVGLTQGSFFGINIFDWGTMQTVAAAHGDLAVNSVSATVSQTAAVPEPATWAMMILGFGAAGAVLRRGRTLARAA